MYPQYLVGTTADYATATAGNATITYTAATNYHHIITGVAFSYSGGTFSSGNIQIKDGTDVIFNLDVTAAGAYVVPFPEPKAGSLNKTLTVVLGSGGTSVVGKVNVLGHLQIK